ncbi:unnamed protein product [Effrenium voratum]|nr:unnamed protein product [Effrenium voratum]
MVVGAKALPAFALRKSVEASPPKIVKLERAVGAVVPTTGRTWHGPKGGVWVELDPAFQRPGWMLIEGPGFGKVGPLLEPAEEALVLRFCDPHDDEEIYPICLKPSYTMRQVKRWMCIRLPSLRLEKIVIVKRQNGRRPARFTPSSFVLEDHVRLKETNFKDGEQLPYIYMAWEPMVM